jgi:hypothetical protein
MRYHPAWHAERAQAAAAGGADRRAAQDRGRADGSIAPSAPLSATAQRDRSTSSSKRRQSNSARVSTVRSAARDKQAVPFAPDHLGEQNLSAPLLMAISGHKRPATLQRYVKPSQAAVAELMAVTTLPGEVAHLPGAEHAAGGIGDRRLFLGVAPGLCLARTTPAQPRDNLLKRQTCWSGARREGFEPPTARSVVCRCSSVWWPVVRRCCSRP